MAKHYSYENREPRTPNRKKRKSPVKSAIYTFLFLICLAVFLGSGWILVDKMLIKPAVNEAVNNDIRDQFSELLNKQDPVSSDGQEAKPDPREAIRELAATVNEDIVGWITVDGTVIDYPVLHSSMDDPEHYLYRTYKDEYSAYGSIFLDAGCEITGDMQVLYGHSMNDGSMFRSLVEFGDPEVVAESPVIEYNTTEEASQWLIISVIKTNIDPSQGEVFSYAQTGFSSAEEKREYLYEVMKRSMVDTGVTVNENDDLLLLSTCSYEFDNFRTAVVARRIRDGETVTKTNVTSAEHTLYPDCWYNRYGGSAYPWPETLDEAVGQGLADWYDG